jgi:hypothetical protein
VYLLFDYVNFPQYDLFPDICFSSYVSIASQNKPSDDYKICGSKRGVKLVTTYNNVLVNFVTNSLKDFAAGFNLMYRIIADPSERKYFLFGNNLVVSIHSKFDFNLVTPQTTTALVPLMPLPIASTRSIIILLKKIFILFDFKLIIYFKKIADRPISDQTNESSEE